MLMHILSLAVAVSSNIHGLGGGADTAAAALAGAASVLPSTGLTSVALASAFLSAASTFTGVASAGFASLTAAAFVAAGVSTFEATAGCGSSAFRKNSASLPSIRLTNTRNDFPSGPTATSKGILKSRRSARM